VENETVGVAQRKHLGDHYMMPRYDKEVNKCDRDSQKGPFMLFQPTPCHLTATITKPDESKNF
jgi:hypothetical protein